MKLIVLLKVTFSLGLGLGKMKVDPERRVRRSGRDDGSAETQTERREVYGTEGCRERGSSEDEAWINDRMASVLEISRPPVVEESSDLLFILCVCPIGEMLKKTNQYYLSLLSFTCTFTICSWPNLKLHPIVLV